MKILVVDDEQLLVKGMKFNLENEGYTVVTGTDGVEAVDAASAGDIDLIVLDLMMPRMNGDKVTEEIIRNDPTAKIMLLTSFGESNSIALSTNRLKVVLHAVNADFEQLRDVGV